MLSPSWRCASSCRYPPKFRVDGTPPRCLAYLPLLGEGKYFDAQSNTRSLTMHHFVGALADDETGILSVHYYLEDLGDGTATPLSGYAHPGLPRDRRGNKQSSITIRNLTLTHNHTYRVSAMAYNGVGMPLVENCSTTAVLIDTTPPVCGSVYIVYNDEEGLKPVPTSTRFQYSTKVMRIAARNFADAESGLQTYYVMVERTDGLLIQPKTWVNLREFITLDVNLRHGQMFVATWFAENYAELTTEVTSNVFMVDETKPVIRYVHDSVNPSVRHLRDMDDVSFVAETEMETQIELFTYDPESGILSSSWCLGTLPGACDVFGPLAVDHRIQSAAESVRGLIDSVTYFGTYTVWNSAGNFQVRASDGFRVDLKVWAALSNASLSNTTERPFHCPLLRIFCVCCNRLLCR